MLDHWWQTETGWAMAANPVGLEPFPTKPGSATLPVPGYDIRILGDDGHELGANEQGHICVRLPLPPGCLTTVWNNHPRFEAGYMDPFPGYYMSGDGGYRDEDGYLFVMGRTDDVINVAGHRLSTGEMEEVVARHPDVAECAVLGVHDDLKGQVPIGFVVLKSEVNRDKSEIVTEVVQMVREQMGPIASFKQALVVDRLPKTRSGKILRGTMSTIADGKSYRVPSTIDDPAILGEIEEAVQRIGYGKK